MTLGFVGMVAGFSFLLALLLIWLLKHYAGCLGLIDHPNARSIHLQATPRGAGVGIYVAVSIALFVGCFDLMYSYFWSWVALFLVMCVGLYDDYYDTSHSAKFMVIIGSTLLLLFDGIVIEDLGTFLGIPLFLAWFAMPFTLFVVVGFTNALNLIDGLDGLAGTLSLIILGSFGLIGYWYEDPFILLVASAFMGALVAFLLFNWYPASLFMGDSGSLSLGFVISILAIESLEYIDAVSILFLAAVPILDTLVVVLRRLRTHHSLFLPDRLHTHHLLRESLSHSTPKSVLLLALIQLLYSTLGLVTTGWIEEEVMLILFVFTILLLYGVVSRRIG